MKRKCPTGKHRFRDELGAKIALAELVNRDHGERRVYGCPMCRGWHTTSQELRSGSVPLARGKKEAA